MGGVAARGNRRGRGRDDDSAYGEDDSSFAPPTRVRGSRSSETTHMQSLPEEEDEEFDEQVENAVKQYQRERRGAPSKYSAPAKTGGSRSRNGGRGSSYKGPPRRVGGNSSAPAARVRSRSRDGGDSEYWYGGSGTGRARAGRRAGRRSGSDSDEGYMGRAARRSVRPERSDPTMAGGRPRFDASRNDGGRMREDVDIERHKQRVEELKNQVRKLQSDIPNLMKDYERQRRTKEDMERKMQSLERQLKERTKELSIRNSDNLALKKENEELIRANEDWKRRYDAKERELGQQQKAVIKLQYLVEWYMSREQRFKAVSRAEMEDLVDEQTHGQKQMEQMDRKLKNGLMNKMEHQQRTYASFVDSVRKQTHMLKKKEDEVKRLRNGLIEKERFLMEQDKLNESLSKELLSNSMDVYKKTVKSYLDKQ